MLRIGIVTGEPSGDMLGAGLISELNKRNGMNSNKDDCKIITVNREFVHWAGEDVAFQYVMENLEIIQEKDETRSL